MSDERVLCFPAKILQDGGWFSVNPKIDDKRAIDNCLRQVLKKENLSFQPRSSCETDPTFKQIIPYISLFKDDSYFIYKRSQKAGESRLRGLLSLGIGGHINDNDGPNFYRSGWIRELEEETGIKLKDESIVDKSIVGLISDDSTDVGKVHFGICHVLDIGKEEVIGDGCTKSGRWIKSHNLYKHVHYMEKWSQLIFEDLP